MLSVLYVSFVEHEVNPYKLIREMKMMLEVKKFLYCIVLLFFIISCSTSNSHDFAASLGSKNFDESYGLAVGKDSNIFITGVFSDTLFFSSTTYLVSKGGSDIFIAKYLKNGELLWLKSIGESANDEAYNIALNGANDIYVCGHIGGRPFVSKYNAKGINFWCSKWREKGSVELCFGKMRCYMF